MQYLKNRHYDKTQHILEPESNHSLCGFIDSDNRQFYELSTDEPDRLCKICNGMRSYPKADPKRFVKTYHDHQREPIELDNETLRRLDALTDSQVAEIFPDDFSQQQFRKGLDVYREIAAEYLPEEEYQCPF